MNKKVIKRIKRTKKIKQLLSQISFIEIPIIKIYRIWQKYHSKIRYMIYSTQTTQQIFNSIYNRGGWGDAESFSGPDSNLENTAYLRQQLPNLLQKYNISSILDAPCGDVY
tara:strand:+ start:4454 stop:4786 length:333 start_codon:yes stop_codon:yes gene_type:complete